METIYLAQITNRKERWTDTKAFSTEAGAHKYICDFELNHERKNGIITVDYEFERTFDRQIKILELDPKE